MFLLPLPLSLPPSSIRTSSPSSLNSGRQRVIYCAAKEIERESGRTATAGGLRYSSGSSYFAAPQHNRRRLGVAPELGRRLRILQRSYKWHPLSPQSPGRSTAPREAEEGGRARASGRQNWPNISTAEWEKEGGKGFPTVDPSATASVCPFPDDCFRVVRRGGIPIIPNRSPICLAATANAICVADAAKTTGAFSFG